MRLTGWILLLIGAAMCATIAWAALGFLLMGVGLISLQVAERRRRQADFVVTIPPGVDRALKSPGLQPPKFEAVTEAAPPPQPRRIAWRARGNGEPYDKEAWRLQLERDPDLARLTQVLADYGPQYVDELAISYLAVPDKTRLGAIVDGIIARATDSQGVPPAPASGSRPPPLHPPEPQVAIGAEDVRKAAPRPTASSSEVDALEASLIAAVEQASAKAAPAPDDPPRSTRENRPTRREPAFSSVPKDPKPASTADPKVDPKLDPKSDRSPPPLPAPSAPGDLEATLIATVAQASASRADPPRPTPSPERAAAAARREPEIRNLPLEAKPAPVPPPLPSSASAALEASLLAAIAEASANRANLPKPVSPPESNPAPSASPAHDLDESLLAALAEVSGEKLASPSDAAKPGAAKQPPSAPDNDDLSEMIEKFAPDSNFLRKQ